MKYAVFILICAVLVKDAFLQAEEGDLCDDGDNNGICQPVDECNVALENIQKGISPKICGFRNKTAIVCCVYESSIEITKALFKVSSKLTTTWVKNSTKSPGEISRAKCKEYAQYSYLNITSPLLTVKPQHEKIYNCHVNAEILTIPSIKAFRTEYPHMANIAYEHRKTKEIQYLCGGSLISEYFVLTAAHCLTLWEGKPKFVTLGVTYMEDNENRQDIKVAETFIYPGYKSFSNYHEIGLLRREQPAVFNQYVRPACLNTIRNITYKTGVVSGWGYKSTDSPMLKDLLKSILNIYPNEPCNERFLHNPLGFPIGLPDGVVDDLLICAVLTSDQRNDPCYGDTGSPLQVRIQNSDELQCMSLIVAIINPHKPCGIVGIPALYTRVSTYIHWIEQIVWPDLL